MILSISIFAALVFIIITSSFLKWHPFFGLLLAAVGVGLANNLSIHTIIESISSGFGTLIGSIGIIVVLGCVLGLQLEKSGVISLMAQRILQFFPPNKSPLMLAIFGAILGIPVFCDSGYVILVNLAKSIAKQAQVPFATTSLSLASGLYTTHTLVPPTPGPVAAAANVGLASSMGLVMLVGIVTSIPTTLAGYIYARWIGKKITSNETGGNNIQLSDSNHTTTTTFYKGVILLVLPIILITLSSVSKLVDSTNWFFTVVYFVGHPITALGITVCLGFLFFKNNGIDISEKAIFQAGPILILTGCGGAFGAILKATSLSLFLQHYIENSHAVGMVFLLASFIMAAIIKTAQGSSTSSLIITSSIVSPLALSAGFSTPISLAILVITMGAGAMSVSHSNDSYFWVVSRLSGFSLAQAYKGLTLLTAIQGIVALLTVLFLYLVWL